ncbi:hypothetical protein SHANETTE_65 [Bacillus phage Shanette]|uniref:Lipoprotein n=1 Tax=Bacillus phage Shanette TaxID=1296656 RepID=S5MML2_9CAUD|nr:hypothetical protein AVV46_gp065 [Bacillus phage Shanette]AGR46965.1 hypothetical protein SHANETTE_65 [Bacillus phage Shanette]
MKKKLAIIGVIGLSMVSLVACGEPQAKEPTDFKYIGKYYDDEHGTATEVVELEHKPTGCRFAVVDDGLTQILQADGKPYCPKGAK